MNWQKTKNVAKNILYGVGFTVLSGATGTVFSKALLPSEKTAEKELTSRQNTVQKLDISGKGFRQVSPDLKRQLQQNTIDSGGVQYEDRNIHIVAYGLETIIEAMGIDKAFGANYVFGYDWRTKTLLVDNVSISTSKVSIQGKAVVMVGTGKDGAFILIGSADLTQFVQWNLKANLVNRGDWEQRYHQQEEGISEPVLYELNQHGVTLVATKGSGNFEVYQVPLPYPKLITFSFQSSSSYAGWKISASEDGKEISIKDDSDELTKCTIRDNVGENFTRKESKVPYSGNIRSVGTNLRIENQKRSCSWGKNFAINFSTAEGSDVFGIPESAPGFETVELADGRKMTYYAGQTSISDTTYLVYLVPTRNSVGGVLVSEAGKNGGIFKLDGMPLDNSDVDRVLSLMVASNNIDLAGYVLGERKGDAPDQLVAYYAPFVMSVTLNLYKQLSKGDSDIKVKGNTVTVYDAGEWERSISIKDLDVYSIKVNY